MSLALKKLELLTLELREMKPTEAHRGVSTEIEGGLQDVKIEGETAKPKRTRRKSRKRKKALRPNDKVCEPVPLEQSQATIQEVAEQPRLNAAEDKAKKEKKTWHRSRRSKRTALVAGSHEAGDQASQKDLGILMVMQSRGQNFQETTV